MTSENGITQLLDSKTGIQPAWIFHQRGEKKKEKTINYFGTFNE
jgi:hypothetical protein